MTHEPHRGSGDSSEPPGNGTSGGSDDARRRLEDRQDSGDADQSAADSDQTAADSDQTAADADQAQAAADQRAADRDQAAADRDLAAEPGDQELEAYRRSQAERSFGEHERQTGTLVRLRTAAARDEQAAHRDATAAKRDMAASARDQLATSLDLDADRAASQIQPTNDSSLHDAMAAASSARQNAAADRSRAATDRERAAKDRLKAASDRTEATIEIQVAQLDELTGVYRRGMGEAILNHELRRAARLRRPLVVGFVDVDDLKAVNDREGYAAGDRLLREVADALMSSLRPYDAVVRHGGDEFVCVLSDVELPEARQRLAEISRSLPGASFTFGLTAAREDDTSASVIERSSVQMRETRVVPKRFPGALDRQD